jgi:hypothetical protein
MVPTAAFPPLTPSTLQVTVELEAPVTPEVNAFVYPVVTLAVDGVTEDMTTDCGVTVTVLDVTVCPGTLVTVKT